MSIATKRTNWFGIWVCFIAGLAAAITITKASPAALDLIADLGLSLFQIGWVMSVVSIATVLLGIISGRLIHHFGTTRILITGIIIISLSPLSSYFLTTFSVLLLERALEGIGVILIAVSAPAMIINLSRPQHLGLSMGIWALWMPVGSCLILFVAPLLLPIDGWQTLWLFSGAVALLVIPLLLRLPEDHVEAANQQGLSNSISMTGAMILAIIFACFSSGFFSILTYLPTYLHTVNGLSEKSASQFAALLPAVLAVGNLLGGFLIHKGIRSAKLMMIAAAFVAVSLWGLFLYSDHGAVVGIMIFYGLMMGIIPTTIFAQASHFASTPRATGMILGMAVTGQGMGILCGPPIVGYLVGPERIWTAAEPFLILLPVIIMLLAFLLPRFEYPRAVQ